jgi:hypothetical protein
MLPIHIANEGWIALILIVALGLIVRKAIMRRHSANESGLDL